MAVISPELKAIFWEALDRPSEVDRRAYLDRACEGDPSLRSQVEALLAAHHDAGGFLEKPASPPTGLWSDAAPMEPWVPRSAPTG